MKKSIFLLLIVLLLLPCLAFAEPPLTKEEIKAGVVANLMRVTTRSQISLEITDNGNYFNDYRDGRKYLGYAHLVYIYWDGTYGQKIRESVEVDFLKVDDRWIVDQIFKLKDSAVLIQEPTKPLPAVPEKLEIDMVIRSAEEALPRANDLMERFVDTNQVYKINRLNVGEPVFEWRGLDYTYAAYVYSGDMEYTLSDIRDKKHKNDQVWTCNCEILMLYNVAKEQWECSVNTKDAQRNK